MDPHANTKLDRKHTSAMKSLLCIYLHMSIYIHEICLNSKAFPVHDNIYNIDNLTKTQFWHIVDITYHLFTCHRSNAKTWSHELTNNHRSDHVATRIPIIFNMEDIFSIPNGTFPHICSWWPGIVQMRRFHQKVLVPESVLKICWSPRFENSPTPRWFFEQKISKTNKLEVEVELALALFGGQETYFRIPLVLIQHISTYHLFKERPIPESW